MLDLFTKSNGVVRNIGFFFLALGELAEQLPIPSVSVYAGVLKVIGGFLGATGVAKAALLAKLSK